MARIAPWLLIATFALVAVGAGVASDNGTSPARVGGDFPSFYAAGEIVLDGDGADLYDATLQQSKQSAVLEDGQFLYFAYPPFVAGAYALLAWMPYGSAFGVHTILAIAALIGALAAMRPLLHGYLDGPVRLGIASLGALVAYPVVRSVMGGQNATFTLLGLALVARFDHENRPFATGAAAGAMLYKPQFGLVVIALLLAGRRWRAAGWAIGFGALWTGIGFFVMGGPWIATWLEAVSAFGTQNLEVNGPLMISAWGWFANLVDSASLASVLAALLVVSTAVPFVHAVWFRRWSEIPWYAAAPLIVIAAPSALYYDASLTAITVLAMLALMRGVHAVAIVAVIAVTWTQASALSAGWSPLFIPIAVAALGFALAAVRHSSPAHNP